MGYVEKQHAAHVQTLDLKEASSFTIDDMRQHLASTVGKTLKEEKNVNPPQHCSGCHR